MIDNVCVYGLEESVKASKYPMAVDTSKCTDEITNTVEKLAQSKIGEGHDNFLNGIIVQFDLSFTIKAWTEMQRYHFIDFVSSQSTMHRITKFDVEKQCNEYVDKRIIEILQEKIDVYNEIVKSMPNRTALQERAYLNCLYNVPTGFILTARMTMNYRQLKTIYRQRHNHRLKEWQDFCKWVETLPHSEFIVGATND